MHAPTQADKDEIKGDCGVSQRGSGDGDGELGDAEMTQQPSLPVRTKPTSKGDTAHVKWGTLGAARRRLGELRGEPRHATARTPGRTPSATLTRAGSGVKRRSCTLRLIDSLEAAGQHLLA